MKTLIRKLRGVLGAALTWGITWAGVAAALSLSVSAWSTLRAPSVIPPPAILFAAFYGIVGVWAGMVFGLVMLTLERRTPFHALSMRRVIAWGILGALSYPIVGYFSAIVSGEPTPRDVWSAIGLCALLGAGSSAAMLHAARHAKASPPEECLEPVRNDWLPPPAAPVKAERGST